MKKLAGIVLPLFIFTLIIFPQTQISLSTPDPTGSIGDRIKVKIIIKTSGEIDDIKFKFSPGKFELISETKTVKNIDKNFSIFEKNFFISFFKTGVFKVGPVIAVLRKNGHKVETRESNSVSIKIISSLTGKEKDILPPKDPIEINGNPFFILKYLFFLMIILFTGLLIFRKLKRKKRFIPENYIQIPPLDEFENRIKTLFADTPKDKKKYKRFFIKFSLIYKRFLTLYYNFNAEEMTSFEINKAMKTEENDRKIRSKFEKIFYTSDLVKFAKHIPSESEMTNVKDDIDFIIETLKEREKLEKIREEVGNVSNSK